MKRETLLSLGRAAALSVFNTIDLFSFPPEWLQCATNGYAFYLNLSIWKIARKHAMSTV